ncbi:MAG: acyl-CoA dehydrogenase family protein [Actinomycetota bacterium]|nr:acyl-CoA dehydrogenase family protein [Actinomycetota bacterium]MDQ3956543.1 acyl-CoA dehydrogenase family protein [Actinomycetota bacterium]
MEFEDSTRSKELQRELLAFMDEHVYPAEPVHREQVFSQDDPHVLPVVMEDLKAEARRRGLWNLFLDLSNTDYAPLAEIMGRSPLAPEATNCAAPDTGNMEILHEFGTDEQKRRWLTPLLEGEVRSCFGMTEPAVASSDPTNLSSTIERDGDEYVVNGRKWWTSGAADPRCKVCLFLGVSDPGADKYLRHSLVLVPMDAPGITVLRTLPVFGYDAGHGHCEIVFEEVRVPVANLLGEQGGGFSIGQARLGPGRIHHCMRAVGMAERALELMCKRAHSRVAFGIPLAKQGVIRDWIAEARIRIEQARLLTLKAAWTMDTAGKERTRTEISAIKVAAAETATWVIDRAIQVHGGAGVSDDFPLALMYAHARTLHIVDGADEVHKMVLARDELHRWKP